MTAVRRPIAAVGLFTVVAVLQGCASPEVLTVDTRAAGDLAGFVGGCTALAANADLRTDQAVPNAVQVLVERVDDIGSGDELLLEVSGTTRVTSSEGSASYVWTCISETAVGARSSSTRMEDFELED